MKAKKILCFLLPLALVAGLGLAACSTLEPDEPDTPVVTPDDPDDPDNPDDKDEPVNPIVEENGYIDRYPGCDFKHNKFGIDYVYDKSIIPELHISVSTSEWNALLSAFDQDKHTTKQIHCDVKYVKNGEVTEISDAGLRLKGNTYSRVRPVSKDWWNSGQFQHFHFNINFRKWNKDDAHTVNGCRKIFCKWFKDDPAYVREIMAYDTMQKAGVWTASFNQYGCIYIKVGEGQEVFMGVYDLIEPIDEEYLKTRKEFFGTSHGFLWKGRNGASFKSINDDFGADLDDGVEHRYELKTKTDSLDIAKKQIFDFIEKYNNLTGDAFHKWVDEHVDVHFLLRTYASFIAVGFWDDYWNDNNNMFFYFNSDDPKDYVFYLIPYDLDNTFGILNTGVGAKINPSTQDPLNWGLSSNPLIVKLLEFDDYREIYKQECLRMVDSSTGILDYNTAIMYIKEQWDSIKELVHKTGTTQDITIYKNASDTYHSLSWSQVPSDHMPAWCGSDTYHLTTGSLSTNFFMAKAASIKKYCE